MPVRIRARNFQSLEDAEIVVDGFTVVTGSNNSGKTAAVRAVQGVFTNAPCGPFVRHGAEKLTVDIDLGDGATVTWEKGAKTKPAYTVNGKTLHPGREVPTEVSALGIRPINAGSNVVWPQIAPQFTGTVFLLDMTGSAIAEAVADVKRVGTLTAALKFAETDKRSAASDLKLRRKDVERAEEELQQFDGVDSVVPLVLRAEQTRTALGEVLRELEGVKGARDKLSQAHAGLKESEWVTGFEYPPASRVEAASGASQSLGWVRTRQDSLTTLKAQVKHLDGVSGVHLPEDPAPARDVLVSLGVTVNLRARLQASEATLQKYSGVTVPVFTEVSEKASKAVQVLGIVRGLQTRLAQARSTERETEKQSNGYPALVEGAAIEVAGLLDELGMCPTCLVPHATSDGKH